MKQYWAVLLIVDLAVVMGCGGKKADSKVRCKCPSSDAAYPPFTIMGGPKCPNLDMYTDTFKKLLPQE